MGHSLGVDAHYISRDPEDHRKRYAEGYKSLRVFEPNPESLLAVIQQVNEKDIQIKEITEKLKAKDKEIEEMKSDLARLKETSKLIPDEFVSKILQDPEVIKKITLALTQMQSDILKKGKPEEKE
jgi:hypothetical protein